MLVLGDHSLKIGSGATPRGGKSSYLDEGPFSLVRSQNVHNSGFKEEGLAYISVEQAQKLSNVELQENDVLINITGDSVARVCLLDSRVLPARVNQHVAILRPKPDEIDPLYLRYFLVSPNLQSLLLALASAGATRNALTKNMLESLEIPSLEISEQRKIGHHLKQLDDKIELNQRMNETLEEMARALFRDWFVDLGPTRRQMAGVTDPVEIMGNAFPADKAKTLAPLFPAKLGEDGLPEGWALKAFGDIVEPKKGKSITKKMTIPGNVPVVAGGLKPAYFHNVSNVQAPVITVSASGANAGFVRLYNENIWASDCSYICREQSKYIYSNYILLSASQSKIYNMQQGAAQPHVYPSDIKRLIITDPPSDVWDALEEIISLSFKKISNNEKESQTLVSMRDLFLPKLMSGEIRLKDVGG